MSIRRRRRGGPRQVAWWLVIPGLVFGVAVHFAAPMAGAWYAFTDWNGIGAAEWVGLDNFREIFQTSATRNALFAASCVALALGFLLCRFIVASKVGKVLIAVRDAESRTRFLGYRVEYYKLFVFTLSACMAGVAGALYVPQVGIINPSEFAPANSIEAVIWVAVGGRGTLYGAVLGGALVNFAKTWLTGAAPEIWLYFLGALFVLVTLLLPKGIVGALADLKLPPRGSPHPFRRIARFLPGRAL